MRGALFDQHARIDGSGNAVVEYPYPTVIP